MIGVSSITMIHHGVEAAVGDGDIGIRTGDMQVHGGLVARDVLAGPPAAGVVGLADRVEHGDAVMGGDVPGSGAKDTAGDAGLPAVADPDGERTPAGYGSRQGDEHAIGGTVVGESQI
ncbi:hypothetical protein ES703_112562 [subsurface metagenome]